MTRENERDAFSASKDRFLMQVVCDRRLGEAATKIAVLLVTGHANRREFDETGTLAAWPSMRTMASRTGLFKSRIDRAVRLLEETGHVVVERPEKRGATHHNRYVLVTNGRTDAANPDDMNGRTTVASPDRRNGRTDAANQKCVNGRTGGDAMAAPVGPKPLEKTLEGRGRAQRAPAPVSDAVLEGVEDLPLGHHDRPPAESAGPGARERARPATAIDQDLERGHEYDEGELSLVPADASDEEPPSSAFAILGETATSGDLDRWAVAEREAGFVVISNRAAVQALTAVWGDLLPDPEGYADRATAGFVARSSDAAEQAVRATVAALKATGSPEAAGRVWARHLDALTLVFAAAGRGPQVATNAIEAFRAAMSRDKARRHPTREAAKTATKCEVPAHG